MFSFFHMVWYRKTWMQRDEMTWLETKLNKLSCHEMTGNANSCDDGKWNGMQWHFATLLLGLSPARSSGCFRVRLWTLRLRACSSSRRSSCISVNRPTDKIGPCTSHTLWNERAVHYRCREGCFVSCAQFRICAALSPTFSHPSFIRTPSNCLSHDNLADGCPCKIRSRGTTGSSMFAQDFCHLCRGRRIFSSGHSDVGAFLQFSKSIGRCSISCLSCPTRRSCNNIHYFFRSSHLGRRRAHCECRVCTWVIFHFDSSEHDSAFELLKLWFQVRIFWGDISPSMKQSGLSCCLVVLPD